MGKSPHDGTGAWPGANGAGMVVGADQNLVLRQRVRRGSVRMQHADGFCRSKDTQLGF